MAEILVGIIVKKAGNKKGFKLDSLGDVWLTAQDAVIPYLEKAEIGATVSLEYVKKGVYYNVTKLTVTSSTLTEQPKKESTGFQCMVCGAALKDGKYKKCYMCNKAKATVKQEASEPEVQSDVKQEPKAETKKTYYDSPEKTAMIQRGNALNAASSAISGNLPGADPVAIKEATLLIASTFLDWLRAE